MPKTISPKIGIKKVKDDDLKVHRKRHNRAQQTFDFHKRVEENLQNPNDKWLGFIPLPDVFTKKKEDKPSIRPHYTAAKYPNKHPNKNNSRSGKLAHSEGFDIANRLKNINFESLEKSILGPLIGFLGLIISPFLILFTLLTKVFDSPKIKRESWIITSVVLIFITINIYIFNLQVASSGTESNYSSGFIVTPVPARRGQIYLTDYSRGNNKIELTSTKMVGKLVFDPESLQSVLNQIVKNSSDKEEGAAEAEKFRDDAINYLSGSLNIPLGDLRTEINKGLQKNKDSKAINPKRSIQYYPIVSEIDAGQKKAVEFLIRNNKIQNESGKRYNFGSWVRVDEYFIRSYPERELLSSAIGYVTKYEVDKDDIYSTIPECREFIDRNYQIDANLEAYNIGYYGLEQKYCSVLMGRNGKNVLNDPNSAVKEQNGADIYLTIDKTLQQKAEEILKKTIQKNTNSVGTPKDAAIIVLNAKSGDILAMASYPTFDPNKYGEADNPSAYRNTASTLKYEVGSSMKPLTVAAALNEYQTGNTGEGGKRLGVSPDWKFTDYGEKGKEFKNLDGEIVNSIRNSQNISYKYAGALGLKEIIRDSINTGIAEIVENTLGTRKLRKYLEDDYLFGKNTQATFASGGSVGVSALDDEKNLNCTFCYSNYGFGQGIYISPMELARAYTALANDGKIVEPRLVKKIIYPDGKVDDGTAEDSKIKLPKPQQVLSQQSTRLVTEYMRAVVEEGYLGQTRRGIDGYTVAAKTGTAQIDRIRVEGQSDTYRYCTQAQAIAAGSRYDCNTNKGLFDHTLAGFAPATNPEFVVLIKISEPMPGQIRNFADTTLMDSFLEMTKTSLEYYGVRKDK